jgi:predicted ATPase/class 3 adenylate cyclase
MADLSQWLKKVGLGQLAGILGDNDVDLEILPDLTDTDLEKLGISLGHRRKLLRAAAMLKDAAQVVDGPPARPSPAAVIPAPDAERRQVTVLFSDLVGSTALSTKLDPEDMGALIKRYQDACAGAVARFDGYIAKFLGDGVLAYFGYPQAREDAAERAVRAALGIVEAVGQIKGPDGVSLQTRVGIATGLVVVGDIIGTGAAREEAIVGETPNLAARLQALAGPNEVLIAGNTYRLLGAAFEYDALGKHSLKGFAEPIPAWRILREASVESRFEAARTAGLSPFVGRAQEMGLLQDRWHLAKQGEGQAVLLIAEPGLGKSRLVESLSERIGGETHDRIVVQCTPYHSNTAFYPVLRQIELAAGFTAAELVAEKLDKLDRWLANAGTSVVPAAPLLANLLSLPTGERYPTLELTPAQRKSAVLSILVDRLLRISENCPVLFIVEDAHWIDPTTQELVTAIIDSIHAARVLVIVTARPEFTSPWTGRDHVAQLALSRLSKGQCSEIIAGIAAAQSITADLVDEILAKTDGVPLFVEELTKALAESQTPDRLAVPATLQDSLMARLDRLGPAKEIAQVAATIGRQFAHALLAAVSPTDPGELDAALARLTAAGLVFPQVRAIELTYSFKHALTRDVAYDSLLRARRQQLHERIARTLEERFPALTEAEPEILAHHFSLAGLPTQASLYHERAGDQSITRFASEAVALFRAALGEAGRMPAGRERDQRELAILLKCGPAIIMFQGHRRPEVAEVYQRAYDLAKELNDSPALFRALWGLWFYATLSRRYDVALARAEELVTLAEKSGDEALFLEAIHCRWSIAFFRGDIATAIADAREGIRHYDPQKHTRLGAEFGGHDPGVCASGVLAVALAQFGRPREARKTAEQTLALARKLNQPYSVAHALLNTLQTYQVLGERAEVSRLASQMAEIAEKFNLPLQKSIASFFRTWADTSSGRPNEALAILEADLKRITPLGPVPQLYAALLADRYIECGQTTAAIKLLEPILRTAEKSNVGYYLPEVYRLRGECLLQQGTENFDAAVRDFEIAIGAAKQQHAHLFQLHAAMSLARAGEIIGEPKKGKAQLEEAVQLFAGWDDAPDLAPARQFLAAHAR